MQDLECFCIVPTQRSTDALCDFIHSLNACVLTAFECLGVFAAGAVEHGVDVGIGHGILHQLASAMISFNMPLRLSSSS